MALKHSVYDTDTHFTINPNTRVLKNESMGKTSLIQYDHNSERFTFEIPRMIEGHDMSLCDVVQIQYNNIDSQTKEQSKGVYDVDDMQIYSEDDNVVILSWLISGNATKYVGSLNFLVRFVCTDEDGTVIYAWNTAIYTGISVSSGINNGEAVAYEYADILEQWRAELEKGNNGSVWQKLYDHEERIDNLEKTGGGDGKSAYEIWLEQGNEGTEADFLASLVGADGESITITDTELTITAGGATQTKLTFSDGTEITISDGEKGANGAKGADGKNIEVTNIELSDEDGGENKITFSDGELDSVIVIRNGNKGSTPEKGTDYFTAEDKAELVEDVLEALPTWTGGSY